MCECYNYFPKENRGIYTCDYCNEDIFDGDEIITAWVKGQMSRYHIDCVSNMDVYELIENLDLDREIV